MIYDEKTLYYYNASPWGLVTELNYFLIICYDFTFKKKLQCYTYLPLS